MASELKRDPRKPCAPGDVTSEGYGSAELLGATLLCVTLASADHDEWLTACASASGLWFEQQAGSCDSDTVFLLEDLLGAERC